MRTTLAQMLRDNPDKFRAEVFTEWQRQYPGIRITLPCGPPDQVCAYPDFKTVEGRRWICPNCGARYRKGWRSWVALKSWPFCAVVTLVALGVGAAIFFAVTGPALAVLTSMVAVAVCVVLLLFTKLYRRPSPTF